MQRAWSDSRLTDLTIYCPGGGLVGTSSSLIDVLVLTLAVSLPPSLARSLQDSCKVTSRGAIVLAWPCLRLFVGGGWYRRWKLGTGSTVCCTPNIPYILRYED